MILLSVFFLQAFFCGRSEYFNALLRDHFSETMADEGNPMIVIKNVPVEAFAAVVYYIYTNAVQVCFSAEEHYPSSRTNLSRPLDLIRCKGCFHKNVEVNWKHTGLTDAGVK
jgi:hypothetical protein